MEDVLAGLTSKSCMVYIDDVLGHWQEHFGNLREVFQQLRSAGLRLKLNKCLFAGSRVVYLGFVVSREGIAPDPQNVEAVRAFPQPHDVKSLRSFLGLASYRHFVRVFSSVANPLFTLTKKDVDFVWSEACEAVFHQLKKLLTEAFSGV